MCKREAVDPKTALLAQADMASKAGDSLEPSKLASSDSAQVMMPAASAWGDWFEGPSVSDDFMSERKPL